jgi:hypothetical protein
MEASSRSNKCKRMANLAQSRTAKGAESRLRHRVRHAVAAVLLAALALLTRPASTAGGVAQMEQRSPLSLAVYANQGETCDESACLSPFSPSAYPVESQQLLHWQAAGIHFRGAWHPDELALILKVLDRFAATFGQARVLTSIQLGLSVDPNSEAEHLTFTRISDPVYGPGSWRPSTGEILINDSLYDRAYMEAKYDWEFLEAGRRREAHRVTSEEAIVAHELGHVLVDGMRMRREQGGIGAPLDGTGAPLDGTGVPPESSTAPLEGMWLEELYAEQININYWPHPFYPGNESLATEVGVWALAVPRPQEVVAFREAYLSPLIYGRDIAISR